MLKKILSLLNYNSFFKRENSLESLKNNPDAKFLFSCFEKKAKDINAIKFVGGCVRQAIAGEFAEDLDLATTLSPDKVKECLKENNINFYETGYEHGTITAILNNQKFEITSLREDIVTDGRHAKVRFTTDWEKDSCRRDFTINSIYMNIAGDIFDPNNGINDLKSGTIRFIGNDEQRIVEDYLRILRYVRFYLQYGKSEHQKKTIFAIKKNINGINNISKERIFSELIKFLNIENITKLKNDKELSDIFFILFPQLQNVNGVEKIKNLVPQLNFQIDFCLILSILLSYKTADIEYWIYKYKVSNKIKNRLMNVSKYLELTKTKSFGTQKNLKKIIYLVNNKKWTKDLVFFYYIFNSGTDVQDVKSILNYIDKTEIPKLPVSGELLGKYGFEKGENMGKVLKQIEQDWIDNDFNLKENFINKYLDFKN
tara:strand:- start:360 stop:1643 length:1284 start_codon:yes stop_codon:yes gene_type:complete